MKNQYYYLVTGLPELTLDDGRLATSVADFKEEIYSSLSSADRKQFDLFFLSCDNAAVCDLLLNQQQELACETVYDFHLYEDLLNELKAEGEVKSAIKVPQYLKQFIQDFFESDGDMSRPAMQNRLASLYYAYAMSQGNAFVSAWFEFNLNVNNILSAITARKFKMDVAANVVGNSEICESLRTSNARDFGLSSSIEYMDQLLKISELHDLVERERKLDQLRWQWLEENTFFDYFSMERLYVFMLQLQMIERWNELDKDKGSEMFRSMIAALKNEVSVPTDF